MKTVLRKINQSMLIKSLVQSSKEQKIEDLTNKLQEINPELKDQYTTFSVDSDFFKKKIFQLHAFQISLVKKAIELFNMEKNKNVLIVDIGDSAGTHLIYLNNLFKEWGYHKFKSLSINLDPIAVKKIRAKGLNAKLCRAEELYMKGIKADIFLCFETLEHLFDPITFLKKLSEINDCKGIVITVPYVSKSRVGLNYIRNNQFKEMFAENTHIFELSPEDWKLIAKFSGWEVLFERKYLQYPKYNFCRLLKSYWKKIDFEGFYGVILKPESSYKNLYKSGS